MMQIDPSEIKLMFFTNPSNIYSGGLITVNSRKSNTLINTTGLYFNNATGPKEIWIETSRLRNTTGLIRTLAHELAHYKLLGERRRLLKNDEYLTDLTATGFGFGIFIGNIRSYSPEPVVAYALAWLSHYRSENPNWKDYLNPTMRKHFDESYQYINQNKDKIKWQLDG